MALTIVGYVLIGIGVIATLLGLAIGAKDAFTKMNDGSAQFALPEKLLDVIVKLLEAPPAKFFCILGLILIVLGMVLTGVEVFGSSSSDARAYVTSAVAGWRA